MTPKYWTLGSGHELIPTDDIHAWGRFFNDTKARTVAADDVRTGVRVSTVFLGIDHNFFEPGGPPLLFETMVFGGVLNEYQWRYGTWDEAVAGHERVVAAVRDGVDPDEAPR